MSSQVRRPVEGTSQSDHDHTCHSARELELRDQQDEFEASRSWPARERVIMRGIEDYSEKKSQDILMEVEELETFLFGPADVAGIITALTENACD